MAAERPPSLLRVTLEEAINWFRARVPITRGAWNRLSRAARRQAFTVSHVARLDVVTQVWRAMDRAIADGLPLEEFQRRVAEELLEEWKGTTINPARRMELIYRQNVQNAYSAGRWQQQTDLDVLRARPFWMYDAVIDSRTTQLCQSLHGTILPVTHDFWKTRYPPNHFGCRAGVRSLTRRQAERRGGATQNVPVLAAEEGFANVPSVGDWQPDLTTYPPRVVAAYQQALQEVTTDE